MESSRPPITAALSRCLRLKCPACGGTSIVASPFQIKHHCPSCLALFKREEGFFVGAIAVNVVTTEAVILAVYVLSLPFISSNFDLLVAALLAIAALFPAAFYHHSWSVWLTFDHMVETLPRHGGRER